VALRKSNNIYHCFAQQFHGRHGKAYLFENTVMNVKLSHKEDRILMTGLHTVRHDARCSALNVAQLPVSCRYATLLAHAAATPWAGLICMHLNHLKSTRKAVSFVRVAPPGIARDAIYAVPVSHTVEKAKILVQSLE
jgi:hypothetical protein